MNTSIPQKNRLIPQYINTEWKSDVIPKPLFCMLKFRANNTEIRIRIVIFDLHKVSSIYWRVG